MHAQQADITFLADMARYMRGAVNATVFPHATLPNLIWWDWNPDSGDTGGILEGDWATVRARCLIWHDEPAAPAGQGDL